MLDFIAGEMLDGTWRPPYDVGESEGNTSEKGGGKGPGKGKAEGASKEKGKGKGPKGKGKEKGDGNLYVAEDSPSFQRRALAARSAAYRLF